VTLDPTLAPKTTASLVALVRDGYYDNTLFHRVVPGFVIQGGDPTQSGSGGPGYTTVDVPPSDAAYTKGVVAMAKAPAEPPGTAGSQFFVVTGADAELPPEYAIVGKVTDGMDTAERIDALGVADGPPSEPVVVTSVTVGVS
jgi:cyclophilin family peptidyl-prolyl cis-trans isomerase